MAGPQKQHEESASVAPPKPSFLSMIVSTFAAAFGVQTDKNRERDFQQGNIYSFIAAGVIFTAIFVVSTILLVKFILAD